MEVIILSGADSDLDEIYSLLDETSGGDTFLRALDRKLELLRKFPKLAARSKIGAFSTQNECSNADSFYVWADYM